MTPGVAREGLPALIRRQPCPASVPVQPFNTRDPLRTKATVFTAILSTVVLLDILTKRWALEALQDRSMELFGGLVPLTLAFNRGAAFGLSIGNDPRWFFVPVTLFALVLLWALLSRTDHRDRFRLFALSLVFSGALGNLIDRVRWDRGVVDFIGPINLGFMHWPIFNVADMAISCGAVALAISFWTEEEPAAEATAEVRAEGDPAI
jgi:signal peptidase II